MLTCQCGYGKLKSGISQSISKQQSGDWVCWPMSTMLPPFCGSWRSQEEILADVDLCCKVQLLKRATIFCQKKNPVVLRNSKRNVGVCYPYLSISGSNYFMQQSVLAEGRVYMNWYQDDGSTRLFPIANYIKEQLCSMEEILSKIRQWHTLQKHFSSSRLFFVVHQQSVVWGCALFPKP